MTTDIVVLERALNVMAACMAIQTVIMVAGALATFLAYRHARVAMDERLLELSGHINTVKANIERISITVDEAATAVKRGTEAVGDVVSDARYALGTVRNGVASVASVAAAPKTAVAIGVLRGVQWWRRRRAAERLAIGESGVL